MLCNSTLQREKKDEAGDLFEAGGQEGAPVTRPDGCLLTAAHNGRATYLCRDVKVRVTSP